MLKWLRGTYRTLNTIHVDAAALRHNLAHYRRLYPEQSMCPVLKANAYGHGLVPVGQIFDEEGVDFLIVDSLYEAYELKKAKIKSPILILGYTFPENLTRKALPFHFAVADIETAEALASQKARIHLKIDTGFNRIGFSVEELPAFLKHLKKLPLKVEGVFTHFADADNPTDPSYTEFQLRQFEKALKLIRDAGFRPKWVHAGGASGGVMKQRKFETRGEKSRAHDVASKFGSRGPQMEKRSLARLLRAEQQLGGDPERGTSRSPFAFFNMIRLGLSLYGIPALVEGDSERTRMKELKPAMEVVSTLVKIRDLKAGDRVSYNGTFTAPHPMKIGVIPFGYYEGLFRCLSNKGCVEVNETVCPIIGRVCMNYTMIDLTQAKAKEGDSVVVYSKNPKSPNSIEPLAKLADTIPYELMVRLAESIRREVI